MIVEATEVDQYHYRTLAALARTCKDFHEVALNKLWREVDLVTLMKVLPRERWPVTGLEGKPRPVCTALFNM